MSTKILEQDITPYAAAKHHFQSRRLIDGIAVLIQANPGVDNDIIVAMAAALNQRVTRETVQSVRNHI